VECALSRSPVLRLYIEQSRLRLFWLLCVPVLSRSIVEQIWFSSPLYNNYQWMDNGIISFKLSVLCCAYLAVHLVRLSPLSDVLCCRSSHSALVWPVIHFARSVSCTSSHYLCIIRAPRCTIIICIMPHRSPRLYRYTCYRTVNHFQAFLSHQ